MHFNVNSFPEQFITTEGEGQLKSNDQKWIADILQGGGGKSGCVHGAGERCYLNNKKEGGREQRWFLK